MQCVEVLHFLVCLLVYFRILPASNRLVELAKMIGVTIGKSLDHRYWIDIFYVLASATSNYISAAPWGDG